jgi:hypothetical protein
MSQSDKEDNNKMKNKNNNSNDKPRENIFEIMDNIIDQLNKTKKLFIIMLLTIMIIPPIAFAATFALFGPPFHVEERGAGNRSEDRVGRGPPGFDSTFGIARIVPIIIVLVWLGVGIRQWFVLSKWSKKYQRYKELQKRIDEKLGDENNHVES